MSSRWASPARTRCPARARTSGISRRSVSSAASRITSPSRRAPGRRRRARMASLLSRSSNPWRSSSGSGLATSSSSRAGRTPIGPSTSRSAATYRPTDPGHRYWSNDERLLNGVVQSEQYRTFGPLLATPDDVLRLTGGGALDMTWHGLPRIDQVAVDQLPVLRSRLERLPAQIEAAVSDVATCGPGCRQCSRRLTARCW